MEQILNLTGFNPSLGSRVSRGELSSVEQTHTSQNPDYEQQLVAKLQKLIIRPAHEPRLIASINQLILQYEQDHVDESALAAIDTIKNLLIDLPRCVKIFSEDQKKILGRISNLERENVLLQPLENIISSIDAILPQAMQISDELTEQLVELRDVYDNFGTELCVLTPEARKERLTRTAYMVGDRIDYSEISAEIARELVCLTVNGKPTRPNRDGKHPVKAHDGLFYKRNIFVDGTDIEDPIEPHKEMVGSSLVDGIPKARKDELGIKQSLASATAVIAIKDIPLEENGEVIDETSELVQVSSGVPGVSIDQLFLMIDDIYRINAYIEAAKDKFTQQSRKNVATRWLGYLNEGEITGAIVKDKQKFYAQYPQLKDIEKQDNDTFAKTVANVWKEVIASKAAPEFQHLAKKITPRLVQQVLDLFPKEKVIDSLMLVNYLPGLINHRSDYFILEILGVAANLSEIQKVIPEKKPDEYIEAFVNYETFIDNDAFSSMLEDLIIGRFNDATAKNGNYHSGVFTFFDNDLWGGPIVLPQDKGERKWHTLNSPISPLLLKKMMGQPFSAKRKKLILSEEPIFLVLDKLREPYRRAKQFIELREEGAFSTEELSVLNIPTKMPQGFGRYLLQKHTDIKNIMREHAMHNVDFTNAEYLQRVEPLLASLVAQLDKNTIIQIIPETNTHEVIRKLFSLRKGHKGAAVFVIAFLRNQWSLCYMRDVPGSIPKFTDIPLSKIEKIARPNAKREIVSDERFDEITSLQKNMITDLVEKYLGLPFRKHDAHSLMEKNSIFVKLKEMKLEAFLSTAFYGMNQDGIDPRNQEVIKQQLEQYTDEIEKAKQPPVSIEETLQEIINAFEWHSEKNTDDIKLRLLAEIGKHFDCIQSLPISAAEINRLYHAAAADNNKAAMRALLCVQPASPTCRPRAKTFSSIMKKLAKPSRGHSKSAPASRKTSPRGARTSPRNLRGIFSRKAKKTSANSMLPKNRMPSVMGLDVVMSR